MFCSEIRAVAKISGHWSFLPLPQEQSCGGALGAQMDSIVPKCVSATVFTNGVREGCDFYTWGLGPDIYSLFLFLWAGTQPA